jgi:hypothetical protein
MTKHPVMNRKIPKSPILINGSSIPPITIKFTITKSGELPKKIEPEMEEGIEAKEPDISIGKGDVNELLEDTKIIFFMNRFHEIFKSGSDVFVDDIENKNDGKDHANENGGNIFPTDGRVSWIVELIAEGGDDTEEEEIGVGEVHWI